MSMSTGTVGFTNSSPLHPADGLIPDGPGLGEELSLQSGHPVRPGAARKAAGAEPAPGGEAGAALPGDQRGRERQHPALRREGPGRAGPDAVSSQQQWATHEHATCQEHGSGQRAAPVPAEDVSVLHEGRDGRVHPHRQLLRSEKCLIHKLTIQIRLQQSV